ncbi:Uncharacterized membrane protein [Kaistia soli DSM 19436]|uniref:Uncharacterized membrane protein n=1 Tax=Kaistia soli DSM 19436 TaxID=1122133 RepID=A0A1M5GS65_9HYPH|nr:DUF2254 domain-containing protein [Kaistia soli]SHG06556.1 Uncharacterized membrane protein [Kaistia soli DSM 19436]
MSRWQWLWRQFTRRLWFRASLIGALGVVAAVLAAVIERYIPWQLPGKIGADAVEGILDIIASSMLAVTTFSLSVMTSAYGSATSNVTPRATKLLMEDRVTQNVLSTFIGSFLFGIVGIVVLKIGAYGDRGRVILFLVTIGVIILIVVTLLRWIDHLTRLGRVGETTNRVEAAALAALESRIEEPYLGGLRLEEAMRARAAKGWAVTADSIGYVQHIDMGALAGLADEIGSDIVLAAIPGAFIFPNSPLAFLEQPPEDEAANDITETIRRAYSIAAERNFDQDPRFGLAVMSEIGSRALSAAFNDSGTAIDVIGRMTRLLSIWAERPEPAPDAMRHKRLHVPALESDDLLEDAFMLMARDGAALVEVQLRIQKALYALGALGDAAFRAAARRQAEMAFSRAEAALTLDADRQRLRDMQTAWQADA